MLVLKWWLIDVQESSRNGMQQAKQPEIRKALVFYTEFYYCLFQFVENSVKLKLSNIALGRFFPKCCNLRWFDIQSVVSYHINIWLYSCMKQSPTGIRKKLLWNFCFQCFNFKIFSHAHTTHTWAICNNLI